MLKEDSPLLRRNRLDSESSFYDNENGQQEVSEGSKIEVGLLGIGLSFIDNKP